MPRGEAEGDGWLIGPYLDVGREASGLNVFDAKHISEGPVWQGILPYPLPLGLHGTFAKSLKQGWQLRTCAERLALVSRGT